MQNSDLVKLAQETIQECDLNPQVKSLLDIACNGTQIHYLDNDLDEEDCVDKSITITTESTLEVIIRLSSETNEHLAFLNFASARNPGGGFVRGTMAQEESLCYASGLYKCLLTKWVGFYEDNRNAGTPYYLDKAIWSPGVPFFRNEYYHFTEPYLASAITCPAPNVRDIGNYDKEFVRQIFVRRTNLVLGMADHYKVKHLVLGAWGCGVFGNDPEIVADVMCSALENGFAVPKITFAVMPGPNYDVFKRRVDAIQTNR